MKSSKGPGVRDIASSLKNDRLEELRVLYGIPDDMAMVVPEPGDRALFPSDGFITVYEVHLKNGLRFPVPAELFGIMRELGVPLAGLQPNAIRYLVSLCVFLRCQEQLLNVTVVKVMFRFTHNLDWITMTPRPEFALLCGGNPDSTKRWKDKFFFLGVSSLWAIPNKWGKVKGEYCTDPSLDDREYAKDLTDLIKAHLGGFHLDKRNIWLLPESLKEAKWVTPAEDASASAPKKSKKKKLGKSTGTLTISGPQVPAGPSTRSESAKRSEVGVSKRPQGAVELPSSVGFDSELGAFSDEDVIAPLVKKKKSSRPQSSGAETSNYLYCSSAPGGSSLRIVEIVESPQVQPVESRVLGVSPDLPAEAPIPAGDISEDIEFEDFQGDFLEETAAEPPVIPVQADEGEPPEEDSDESTPSAHILGPLEEEEEEVEPSAAEPPAVVPPEVTSTPEAGVGVSAVPSFEAPAPRTTGEASSSGGPLSSEVFPFPFKALRSSLLLSLF